VSIFPATDIVSDVARAADSKRAQLAWSRLEHASAARAVATRSKIGSSVENAAAVVPFSPSGAQLQSAQRDASQPASAAQKFEAFLLQSWLETLLPKEETGVFGLGGAGNVWRSLVAEQLGEQLARAGGIGVRKLLAGYDAGPSAGA